MSSPFAVRVPRQRLDWQAVKDQVSIEAVAEALLGPPANRSGSTLVYHCPLPGHEDHHPSFTVDLASGRWRCWSRCGEHGDALELVKRMEALEFPEAVRRVVELCGLVVPSGDFRPPPTPKPAKAPGKPVATPTGLPREEAERIALGAAERLWRPEGRAALDYLRGRGLEDETIRSARLGHVDRAMVPKRDGRGSYPVSGVSIPWFDGGRLAMVKVRRLDGREPKYLEIHRDGPTVYPGPDAIRPGLPLVAVEGEFDALLLHQLIGDFASVLTAGGADGLPAAAALRAALDCPSWFAAHDADDAGERAAGKWLRFPWCVRVRPPEPDNDWGDVHAGGFNRIRYVWGRYLPLGTPVDELESQRWEGPDDGPEDLGCVADDPTLGEEPRR